MICSGCFNDKGSSSVCGKCGYDERSPRQSSALPNGVFLNGDRYRIGKLLGRPGGFGITYLGRDERLMSLVAIKEFFPRDIAHRQPGRVMVEPNTPDDLEILRCSLTSFLGEARTLAALTHTNIVKVRDFFSQNGTAYLVMDYYAGMSLHDYVLSRPKKRLDEKEAIKLILPLLDGLRSIHKKGFLHRDIKPLNIYITASGSPILLDFGAARLAVGERTQSLTVILSAGYAPIEQYQRNGKQGPWTDIYAVAATFYMMVTGRQPIPVTDRLGDDPLFKERFGVKNPILMRVLKKSMELDYRERTGRIEQIIADFKNILINEAPKSVDNVRQDINKRYINIDGVSYYVSFVAHMLGVGLGLYIIIQFILQH